MSWLLAFLGFATLIILHEAGHFAAAKAVGMRVERFSLFFPPLIARFRRPGSETEYAIGATPLGGYVKITGMNPNEEIPPEHAHRAYYRQPVWKRIVVIAAGPAVNLVLAFVILWGYYGLTTLEDPRSPTSEIGSVQAGSPAEGQLRPGDVLVAVDGVEGDVTRLRDQLATHRCAGEQADGCIAATPATITVLRDGERRSFEIRPRYDAEVERPLVGFGFRGELVDLGFGESARQSVDAMWQITSATVSVVGRIFVSAQARDEVGSVVGGYEVTRQAFTFDVPRAFFILGLISLSLAVINLFPFLPLDGGHIFWALTEKVRGRAVSFRTMEKASVVGFMLVIFIFFIGVTNDIERITSGELNLR
jgi:regulator of sigma E protease